FFVIDGQFYKENRQEHVVVSVKKRKKKIIKRNGKAYEKVREHIGLIPVVIISPADRDIITEGSDTRRKFMDGIIAQSDLQYLQTLLRYKKALAQRNALLKYFAANRTFNADSLALYNIEMQTSGAIIYQKRQ